MHHWVDKPKDHPDQCQIQVNIRKYFCWPVSATTTTLLKVMTSVWEHKGRAAVCSIEHISTTSINTDKLLHRTQRMMCAKSQTMRNCTEGYFTTKELPFLHEETDLLLTFS